MQSSAQMGHGGAAIALAVIVFGACSLDTRALLEARGTGAASGASSSGAGGELGAAGSNTQFGGTGAGAGDHGGSGSGGSPNRDGASEAASDSSTGDGASGATGAGNGGAQGGTSDARDSASSEGCGDLDENGVQDCAETLLRNARFDVDASNWQAEPNAEQQWDSGDGRGATGSGALSLVNANFIQTDVEGMTMVGSQQCLDVRALQKYKVAAQIFIPDGQGEGYAGISVFLYSGPSCTRTLLHAYTPVFWGEVGIWGGVAGTVETSPATQSMRVRLVASKPFSQTSFKALFDNVLVRSD